MVTRQSVSRKLVMATVIFSLTGIVIWRFHTKEWPELSYSLYARSLYESFIKNITMSHFPTKVSLQTNTSPIFLLQKDRIAVVCYVPRGQSQVFYFLALLFGSWKYIQDHKSYIFKDPRNEANLMEVDLLVFCHPSVCPDIKTVCQPYNQVNDNLKISNLCWAIEQPFEIDISYNPINSFVMFNRTDIFSILMPYKYIIRTDFDVFLTPALMLWRPNKRVITGHGGYCAEFNIARLRYIAGKLGLTHRGVHCVGSTWFGERDLFILLSKKTIELTAYMFINEFTPKSSGLETVNFTQNREGEWPKWWRPVSLLYGAELALNHLIPDFSSEYINELDTPSCSKKLIWESPHIHCWHSDCEFQKFTFMAHLNKIIFKKDMIPSKVVHKILESASEKDIGNMTISDYSTYIAWHSVATHFKKWIF
ncbi:uncharacterized protein LOC105844574 [Hydra vulgaris]|uniref:uncharacterized protein LOC105844574 n=1 Tax=Hydra vulgaris TaxID=6087 RepID=UPI001F5FB6F8|nr:uncharacterized protein LOC105844574 [Hydra vulgaris]XP_012556804.2 uncharacterized protein LOC105844574 [Hydra vulgaris]